MVPKTEFRNGMDLKQRAAAASLDLIALQAYADKADALLKQCAKE